MPRCILGLIGHLVEQPFFNEATGAGVSYHGLRNMVNDFCMAWILGFWGWGDVLVAFLVSVCVCVSSSVPKSDSQNGIEAIQHSRGAQEDHRAVPNEALYGNLRISSLASWTYLLSESK